MQKAAGVRIAECISRFLYKIEKEISAPKNEPLKENIFRKRFEKVKV